MGSLIPRREDVFFPLEQQFQNLFDEFFNRKSHDNVKGSVGFPKMNIHETNTELVMTVSVPGMKIENLSVEISPDNILTLAGSMSQEYHVPENSKVYVRELRQSTFQRKIQLPDSVSRDNSEPTANLKEGILILKWQLLPQVIPKPTTKKIMIKSE